ncbi:phosphoglycerate mutase [Clostridium botulinum]|uniref:Phosphoglycerate mutase n=2 Tax=Clostridium botulinum TaxID=1491 RepID=A0A9Q1UWK9_CLOBO|nr:phosphoglycerate mutase family protein [Clostridium botulinum BKT015925]KLU76958.1 phosphoglycerate mutase [Clostridium botulinum V891]KOA76321.1 phosphoglycerate mutase [Clostridium botulinum]MCD3198748.1 histidine phosphatase family protein [Clostridium botulinum C/D]KOA79312.1 phosphoglycerate mutase [Clostridium botulinum]
MILGVKLMTTIYLTRHGQTQWNLNKRLQGWKNSPLTELGISQAEALRDRLKDMELDIIYTSPIERAYKTAEIIRGDKKIEIVKNDGLKELNYGEWEGSTIEEIEKNPMYNEQLDNLFNHPKEYVPFGGETYEHLIERIDSTMNEILEKNKDKKVLIVTHGMTLKALIHYFNENMTINDIVKLPVMGQTSLTQIDVVDGKYNLVLQNDTSHYDDNHRVQVGW